MTKPYLGGEAVLCEADCYKPSECTYHTADANKRHQSLELVLTQQFKAMSHLAAYVSKSTVDTREAMLAIANACAGGKLIACVRPALSVKDMCLPRYEDEIKAECANEGRMYAPMTIGEKETLIRNICVDAVRLVELCLCEFVLRGNKASGIVWKEKDPQSSREKRSWEVTDFLNSCSIEDKRRLAKAVGRLYFGAGYGNGKAKHLYLIVDPDSVLWDEIGLLVKVMRHKSAPTQSVSGSMHEHTQQDSSTPQRSYPQRSYDSRKEVRGVGKAKRDSSSFISFVVAVSIAACSMEGGLERAEGSQRASAMILESLNDAVVLHFEAQDALLLQKSTKTPVLTESWIGAPSSWHRK